MGKRLKQILKFVVLKVFAVLYFVFKLFHRLLSELAFRCRIKEYLVGPIIIKKFKYKQIEIGALIETYWNYWRLGEYEQYPVKRIENDINSSDDKGKGIVYYEIGANVGYSFLVIGKMLEEKGEVFAFEIEPANFKTLSNNILINELKNATAIPIGIAESPTIQKFYFNRWHDKASLLPSSGMGMHSVEFNSAVHKEQCFYKASLMPLDTMMEQFSMPCPTHVFIDAYGAEDFIVAGMKETLKNDKLKIIMVDVEVDLEKSRAHKIILESGFELSDCITEKGENLIPTSYKCTYSKEG